MFIVIFGCSFPVLGTHVKKRKETQGVARGH